MRLTYDVHFNDDQSSNCKGFKDKDEQFCLGYIRRNINTDNSYFADYKGGTVSIVANETEEIIYEEVIPIS